MEKIKDFCFWGGFQAFVARRTRESRVLGFSDISDTGTFLCFFFVILFFVFFWSFLIEGGLGFLIGGRALYWVGLIIFI